ncbi:MAG: hypothetical protein GY708_26400 [Actinomycetia bacterium]|nr:hypothetical protein [Actinomycetes bacterium]
MTIVLVDDLPLAPPLLDRAAVEHARLARLAREHIASTQPCVDYEGLAAGRGSSQLAARQWVKRHRAAGRLFVVDYDGGTLMPSFQLDEVFDLDPRVAPSVERLTEFGMSSWAMWQWFCAHNPWIGARPVDVIGTEALEQAVSGLVDA